MKEKPFSHHHMVKEKILDLLGSRTIRMTPSDLLATLARQLPQVQRKALRHTINAMVFEGSLRYTNHFSTTHLELNFNRPIQISRRIWIRPVNCSSPVKESENAVAIVLQDGAAFGVGDHPTTRLCLQGLDYALDQRFLPERNLGKMTALDIGTGSGVLAIAVRAMGVGQVLGIDFDALACREAGVNVDLNGMSDTIRIESRPLQVDHPHRYDIIMANLRSPTLKKLIPIVAKIAACTAIWVLSGFRKEEAGRVLAMLPQQTTKVIWQRYNCSWAAMVVVVSQSKGIS